MSQTLNAAIAVIGDRFAISRPTVVIVCMLGSSESWEPQQRPPPGCSSAGGGAVHNINSRRFYCVAANGRNGPEKVISHLPLNGRSDRWQTRGKSGASQVGRKSSMASIHMGQAG